MPGDTEWINYLQQFDLDSSYFQNIPYETNKYCVMIEPRKHELLLKVIKNFMYLLQNKGWGLIIFHGTNNEVYLKDELKEWKNVKYVNMCISNLNIHEYNNILTTTPFWQSLKDMGCIHSFIFQCDTILLKDNVNDFLKYDFVGAPWCIQWYGIQGGFNGGLSLRNVNTMIDVIIHSQPLTFENTNIHVNEDIYFAYFMDQFRLKYHLPDREKAMKFSVETVYYHDPIGMHQPHVDKFPSRDEYVRILSKRYQIE